MALVALEQRVEGSPQRSGTLRHLCSPGQKGCVNLYNYLVNERIYGRLCAITINKAFNVFEIMNSPETSISVHQNTSALIEWKIFGLSLKTPCA